MFSGFASFQTLERKKDRLDLIPELMGERAEKSLTLGFKNAGFRGGVVAFLFGLFDVLIDRGSRAKVEQIQGEISARPFGRWSAHQHERGGVTRVH